MTSAAHGENARCCHFPSFMRLERLENRHLACSRIVRRSSCEFGPRMVRQRGYGMGYRRATDAADFRVIQAQYPLPLCRPRLPSRMRERQ